MINTTTLPLRKSEVIEGLITELRHIEHKLVFEHTGAFTKPMFYRASQVRKMIQNNISAYGYNISDRVLAVGYDVVFEYDYLFKNEDYDPKNLLHYTYVNNTKILIASAHWFKTRLKEKRNETSNQPI